MKFFRSSSLLVLILSCSLFPAEPASSLIEDPPKQKKAEKSIALKTEKKDLFLEFEYIMASLNTYTYQCIQFANLFRMHPFLEIPEQKQKKINALNTFFYIEGNFSKIKQIFKFDPIQGIDQAIDFMEHIADILHIRYKKPNQSKLTLLEQKIEWLFLLKEKIKTTYIKLYPSQKKEGWQNWLKRSILLSPLVKNIDLQELSRLNIPVYLGAFFTLPSNTWAVGEQIVQKKQVVSTGDNTLHANSSQDIGSSVATLFMQFALCFGAAHFNSYLVSLEQDKGRFIKKNQFIRHFKQLKKTNAQDLQRIDFYQPKPLVGFKNIEGIQDDAIIKELSGYAEWLKHPFLFHGNHLALLLHGPPGNGKGMIMQALANASNTPIVSITAQDIKNNSTTHDADFKLETARSFARLRKAKSIIIFFDEFDLLLDLKNTGLLEHLLKILDGGLGQEEGIRIVYAFATNYIGKVNDERLMRAGRMTSIIEVKNPSLEQRFNLVTISPLLSFFDNELELVAGYIAQNTESFSRAAVNAVIVNTLNSTVFLREKKPNLDNFLTEITKLKSLMKHSEKSKAKQDKNQYPIEETFPF